MRVKYVNPFTDFGFKKIFGEEASKVLLMDFLNSLLPEGNKVADLSFRNPEQLGKRASERRAVYDIYCENEKGERFIVELQKAKQNYFKERTVYYSTFPIREQADKGEWHFNLKSVYCIGILDFTFEDYENESEKTQVVHTIKLRDPKGKTFYDKLTYIYLEMPNFRKTESELETRLEKWLYFIKHLEDFEQIPFIFKDDVFVQAFEKAELARFDDKEMENYEHSLKIYRDLKNVIDTAMMEGKTRGVAMGIKEGRKIGIREGREEGRKEGRKEGREEGREEGRKEGRKEGREEGREEGRVEGKMQVARALKESGVATDVIISATGLSEHEINML